MLTLGGSRYVASILILAGSITARAQLITTVAGGGLGTGNNIPGTSANVAASQGIATDGAGNVFFWDATGIVRELDVTGNLTTVAGNGTQVFYFVGDIGDGGKATSAAFGPLGLFAGVAVDAAGNLYIADPQNKRVRVVDTSGIINTLKASVGFNQPSGVAVDKQGNVYVADITIGRVYKIDKSGNATTVAGGGTGGDGGAANKASILAPYGIALDDQGNLYIAENNTRVRKVDTSGNISTIAGGTSVGYGGDHSSAKQALLYNPEGLALDSAGNLYIADRGNYRVRKVDTSGIITTVAGNGQFGNGGDDGLATDASVQPGGIALDSSGNLYIANGYVRKVNFGKAPPGLYASSPKMYFEGTVSHPGAAAQVLRVATLGAPIAFNVTASVQSGGSWLGVSTPTGNTPQTMNVEVTNPPTTAGTYNGTITCTPTTPGYSPISVQVTLVINGTPPATPVITDVENGASFQSGYLANSIWTIKGTNLASISGSDNWNSSIAGGELPASLDGVTVTFGGYPAYISYLSSTQINVVSPNSGLGGPLATVNNNGASSGGFPIPGSTAPYSPAFFTWPNSQVVATRTDYSYSVAPGTFSGLTTIAAKPGDVLILWGTGFAGTTPPVQEGAVVPSDQEYACSTTPTVTVGTASATVYGCALAAGYAGLYQVAIQVPPSLKPGTYPIVATMGVVPVSSPNNVMLAVQP